MLTPDVISLVLPPATLLSRATIEATPKWVVLPSPGVPSLVSGEGLPLLTRGSESREHLHRDWKTLQTLPKGLEVLESQQGSRHEHRHLFAIQDGQTRGAHGDLGLAEADVATDQPIHRLGSLHIRQDVLDGLGLIRCLLPREGCLEVGEVLPWR